MPAKRIASTFNKTQQHSLYFTLTNSSSHVHNHMKTQGQLHQ